MSNILTGFNMQGNDPIDNRIVSPSKFETLEEYLQRVPIQKRYYGLSFYALDENNELRHYTFQTSLIEPTIDDDEEEIERLDKELQEHVNNKEIHKTSEEIRSEIVDADIPDTIARVQWTLDKIEEAVNTVMGDIVDGASDEYNTLKKIQDKIVELRTEVESQLYGDDGGEVLKTLEQALKFLNQYKDFIVDIPDNYVNKQDIVDNLNTDDPTKVLSARQGKVLSETLTNYFDSAMASIRAETNRATNAENRIEAKLDSEIDRSTAEDIRIQSELDAEEARAQSEEKRIEGKLDAEIERSTTKDTELGNQIIAETNRAEGEEQRIETKLDNEITRSTAKDADHDSRIEALEGETHVQNTDIGTTSQTFQLQMGKPGNKIKNEDAAISVRNADDSDYANFIAKNATFKGDLIVEGQSFVTEAETVEIKDNLLLLNKGEVGAGVAKGIAGLEIDRGTEPNYQIIFDESDNRFKAGEIGDIQCLALRDGDDSMVNGMFTTWDSTTKRLKTTNIVPSSSFLYFGDNKTVSLNYSPANDGSLTINTNNQYLAIFTGDNYTNFRSTRNKFQFIGDLYTTGTKYALTFKRGSDNSEVLYHADIVNNLTSGGTNKVLSAEQGKLLQNSITSIQGSYLPLSGGTMTGSINLPSTDPLKMIISGSVDSVLSYWPSNNAIEFGNNKRKIFLRTDNSNIIHYINGSSYSIYDAYNLPDPVTLSGNNTFTGNNIFQAGKFNVGPFEVTSNGSLLSNISSPAGSAWSRSLVFRANNDIPSSLVFGGYNSVDNTSIGHVYIGIGDINYQTAQYKFYANSLRVPYQWSIDGPDGAAIVWSQTSEIVNLGRAAGTTKIRSGNTDLIHTKGSTEYIIWDKSNLPNPASTTDLNNYLPLVGGTLTGQLTIKQLVDIKLRLQSTDADNHCIIQAINSQASQLGVFGYAGDKWAIGHNGTYYEIWDKYNLTNPVTYTTNTYNYATLTNKDGQYFTYIKAGTDGLLPHSQVTLANGGAGFLGTSDQSFNAAYINHLYTNKISFGVNGPYIIGSTSATQFLDANGGAQKVATGGLYVGASYASDALSLVPDNGIYSRGIIYIESGIGFRNSIWTNNLTPNRNSSGYLQVLDAYDVSSAGGPTNYGTVLQVNSRNAHWANQLWFSGAEASKNGLYYRHMPYNSTTYGEWIKLATTSDLGNYLPLSGGTLSGNLTINTVGSTTLVINNNDTNGFETFMRVLRKGTASAAIGFMDSLGAYIYNYNSNKYLFIDNDGYARVGTTSGSTRLALITDIPTVSGYLPLSGGTLSGALTMSNRRNNVVVDVVGGAGHSWDGGAGALSVQVPSDTGQTPLLLARRSGATINTTTLSERLLDMALLDTGTIFRVGMSGVNALELGVTSFTNKVGIGKLFGKKIATTDQIPSIPSISISNSGSGNAVTAITASGHTLTVTKGATYLTSSSLSGYATQSWVTSQGYLTSSSLSDYATQTWVNNKNYAVRESDNVLISHSNEFNFTASSNTSIAINYRGGSGSNTSAAITEYRFYNGQGSYSNVNLVANSFTGSLIGNATTATTATKLGSSTIGGTAKPIYLSSGTATACSATVGSSTVPVYMNAGTITQCSTTLGVSITGNAATATNATQLGGTAASSYVKANDNISRLTNDSGYTTQEWVNGQGFLTSDSMLDKFVPTTGGYIRNSDQVLLRLQRTGVSTGTSRTIEMYFDDSNTDGTSTTPRGSIGYNSEVGMFLYSAVSKKFLAMEYTGRPFYGTPTNRYYLLGSNTQYHNLDGYQRIGDIMIQWGYFTVQGNSTRAVNFPVSFTNTVWSVTGSWDNSTTGGQENWGFTDYTSSGFTIINGDGSSRVFHYIAIGPFTRS